MAIPSVVSLHGWSMERLSMIIPYAVTIFESSFSASLSAMAVSSTETSCSSLMRFCAGDASFPDFLFLVFVSFLARLLGVVRMASDSVGVSLGCMVGLSVGARDKTWVGCMVGLSVGVSLGCMVGLSVGASVGSS